MAFVFPDRLDWNSVTFIHLAALVLCLACASPESARRADMPSVGQADARVVLEGTMEVLIEDTEHGSRTLYFLMSGDRRVPLRFLRRPLNLTTGTRVRVRGRWDEHHTLVVSAIERLEARP